MTRKRIGTCKQNVLTLSDSSAKKRGPPKGYVDVLESRLRKMESMLDELFHKQPSTASDMGAESLGAESSGAEREKLTEKTEEILDLPLELTSVSSEGKVCYLCEMNYVPFVTQRVDLKDVLLSRFGKKFKRLGDSLFEYEAKSKETSNQGMLQQLGILGPTDTIKGLNDWIYKVSGMDKATSDALMKVYFAYIHPVLPVLNKSLFLKQYRGQIKEYPSAPLLNSIYGAAVRYIDTCRRFGDTLPDCDHIEVKAGWSEKLFENIITYLKVQNTPRISTVQALAIANTHRASLDSKITSGWLLNCVTVRMAQHIGLHRSSDQWEIPESEKETRKRLWWSIYIIDRWSAASTGKPQTILDEDCDEGYPKETASWDEIMDTTKAEVHFASLDKNKMKHFKGEIIPYYQTFVQIAKLSEILGKILQGLYTPLAKKHSEQHGSDAVVAYLDKALSEWRSALPPSLQFSADTKKRLKKKEKDSMLSLPDVLHLCYFTLLILLHRPFIEKGQGNSTSSINICTSAAIQCVDLAEKMHYRNFLLVSWNFVIYPVFTAALIHIYNATQSDNQTAVEAKGHLKRAIAVIRQLGKLSVGANQLHTLLLDLTKFQKIDVDDDDKKKRKTRDTRHNTDTSRQLVSNESNPHTMSHTSLLSDNETRSQSAQTTSSGDDCIRSMYTPPFHPPPNPMLSDLYNPFGSTADNPLSVTDHSDVMMQYIQQQQAAHYISLNSVDSLLLGVPQSDLDNLQYNLMMPTETTFRNRPDNPFWSVPSSIEADEWAAYLAPGQQEPSEDHSMGFM
ncbi:hypothetical protein G6F61_007775 [Rhizopus arrhizus]|nr:hypothetical protein G6F61_007775 [Rhizopus arrhizus]